MPTTSMLELALLDVEDVFGRAICPFILLQETAQAAVTGGDLTGTGIDVGVFAKDLTKEVLSTLQFYVKEFDQDVTKITYIWNDVPIRIQIIHENYPFFTHPSNVVYNFGDYLVPNTFKAYWAWKDKIE